MLDFHSAAMDVGVYTISCSFGTAVYGSGPDDDQYEISAWYKGDQEPIPLTSDNDVIGWMSREEIDQMLMLLENHPDFGNACFEFKRTRYGKRYNNIGHYTYEPTS